MSETIGLRFAPGLFTESTDRGADGRWRDGDMVRFNHGMPEGVGGWAEQALTGETLVGVARAVKDWTALDGLDIAAVGTNRKLYLFSGNRLYNITPFRDEGTLTDPFDTTNGSAIVTVTHSGHGTAVGDAVFFSNATAVGGLTIDGEYSVTSVVDVDTYTITAASNATSTASGGSSVGHGYEIAIGGTETGVAQGWGTCGWGGPDRGWGTPCADSTMIIPLRVWSLDTWGEDLIASPSGGAVYWWRRALGFGQRAQLIEGAPRRNTLVLVSEENRQLICVGTVDPDNKFDAMFIRWSDNEDFETFVITTENNAGSKRIDGGSALIGAVQTRNGIVLWTDKRAHLMQPSGGDDVYAFRGLGKSLHIAGPNAVVDANGVVYAMGLNNFTVFDGTLRVMECDIWTRVFKSFNIAQRRMVYAALNADFSEIWWFYPSAVSNAADRLAVYNYRENLWWYGDLERSAFSDQSPHFLKPYGFSSDGTLYLHESGVDDNGAAMPRYITSDDLEIGEGKDIMHVSGLIPDFKTLVGTATITLKGKLYPADTAKTKGPHNVTSATRRVSTRMRARQVSVTVAMTSLGGNFRMGEWRAEARPDGER